MLLSNFRHSKIITQNNCNYTFKGLDKLLFNVINSIPLIFYLKIKLDVNR
jgi:hypothetical protein